MGSIIPQSADEEADVPSLTTLADGSQRQGGGPGFEFRNDEVQKS